MQDVLPDLIVTTALNLWKAALSGVAQEQLLQRVQGANEVRATTMQRLYDLITHPRPGHYVVATSLLDSTPVQRRFGRLILVRDEVHKGMCWYLESMDGSLLCISNTACIRLLPTTDWDVLSPSREVSISLAWCEANDEEGTAWAHEALLRHGILL